MKMGFMFDKLYYRLVDILTFTYMIVAPIAYILVIICCVVFLNGGK